MEAGFDPYHMHQDGDDQFGCNRLSKNLEINNAGKKQGEHRKRMQHAVISAPKKGRAKVRRHNAFKADQNIIEKIENMDIQECRPLHIKYWLVMLP